MRQSDVIFIGTIVKLNAASFSEITPSEKTAVVRVEQLLQKPAAISLNDGQEITLELLNPRGMEVNTTAMFYADGWILGRGIALREVGHAAVVTSRDATPKQISGARKQMIETQTRARLDGAEIVALGKVTRIQPAPPESRRRITEHDPNWQDAVIKVSKGVKGVSDGSEIVVRFPASMDVAFYGMAKFKEGDERVLLLRKDIRSGLPKTLLAEKQVDVFMVEKPADVFGKEQLEQVMEIMRKPE